MIVNWFLVAVMSMSYTQQTTNLYIFTDPSFTSSEQCIEFVKQPENGQMIAWKLKNEFPLQTMQNVYCVPENEMEKILEKSKPAQKELNI
ncbi:MAG: hypothetical protein CMA64_06885 [Euryarchaeota archaeon]|nr:hypothetical protein [Euryarchaeota archaeon]